MDQDFLNDTFVEIADWIYDRTGLELPPELHTFEIYANPRGRTSCQGKLSYRGPIAPRSGGLPRIKLDLTADEHVALAPVPVPIFHAVVERAGSAAFTISDLLQRPNTLIRARRLSPQQESVFLFFKAVLGLPFCSGRMPTHLPTSGARAKLCVWQYRRMCLPVRDIGVSQDR